MRGALLTARPVFFSKLHYVFLVMDLEEDSQPEFNIAPENWFDSTTTDLCTDHSAAGSPPVKKRKLSLCLRHHHKTSPLKNISNSRKRFTSPVKESEFHEAGKGVVPKNTKHNNQWAIKVFRLWMQQPNVKVSPEDAVPTDILESSDCEVICKFLRYFTLEVRREDGERYNPGTIRSLLCGLNRTMKKKGGSILNY